MNKKPLGHKNYGSIPHLLGSKLGEGDHHISEGQHNIAVKTAATSNKGCRRRVIVQEKLDGSNVGIAKVNNNIVAITRAGYLAETSPFDMHHKFAKWVKIYKDKFDALLEEGERVAGEWMYQAHGLLYTLPHELFVAFDLFKGQKRCPYNVFKDLMDTHNIVTPGVISEKPVLPKEALNYLRLNGSFHGCLSVPEGVIYRVEIENKPKSDEYEVDFLCKYVRHSFEPGVYLSGPAVFNQYNDIKI